MIAFIVSLGLSLIISLLLVLAIRKPLYELLLEVCGTDKRAKFWQVFTNALLFMSPLLAVTVFVGVDSSTTGILNVSYLRQTLGSIIGGLLFILLIAGWQIKSLIPSTPPGESRMTRKDENYGVQDYNQ